MKSILNLNTKSPARGDGDRFVVGGLTLIAVALLLGAAGCADRTYLTKSHGRAYSEAFARQAVPPQPRAKTVGPTGTPGPEPTEGLDSQEASAVARSYRQSLAGKEGTGENSGQAMVLTNPGAAQPAPYMPPPSVPNGQ